MKLTFTDAANLSNWLATTTQGNEILSSILPAWVEGTKEMAEAFEQLVEREAAWRAKRATVLVVCHADGMIEAYGDEVKIHFADLLDVEGQDATNAAEAYMELYLPPHVRPLVMQRSTLHFPSCRTPEAEHAIRTQLACLRAIPRLKDVEAERLRREAERREAAARKKYPHRLLVAADAAAPVRLPAGGSFEPPQR